MPTTPQESKKREPSELVSFEVPLAAEIREVAKLTGIPAKTIRAQVIEKGCPELLRVFGGKIHALVVARQAEILQRAAKSSLEAGEAAQ